LRVFLNNVTWRLFLSKLLEFSKINSCPYQKRETPELEGALLAGIHEHEHGHDSGHSE